MLSVLLATAVLTGDAIADRIERFLQPFDAAHHLSGTVVVARRGEVIFERAYGMASYELEVPNTPTTRFCIASVTKPMTQAICIQLLEAKALALSDPISNWIEDFPRGDDITVDMLINHRAGIAHRVTSDADEVRPMSAADVVELARKAPLIGEPGKRSVYSSAGYSVLARILEIVSGKSYAQLLRDRVLAPAQMTDSCHVDDRSLVSHRAQSYFVSGRGIENAPVKEYSFLVGAGSVWATARDLVRLVQAMRDGKLGKSVQANLVRPGGVHWNGITNGYRAFVESDASADTVVAFTGNLFTGAGDWMHKNLLAIASGQEVSAPVVPVVKSIDVPTATLEHYVGSYDLSGTRVDVRMETGGFYAGDRPLVPVAENEFFSFSDYGTVTFELDADGRGKTLLWKTPEVTLTCPRLRE